MSKFYLQNSKYVVDSELTKSQIHRTEKKPNHFIDNGDGTTTIWVFSPSYGQYSFLVDTDDVPKIRTYRKLYIRRPHRNGRVYARVNMDHPTETRIAKAGKYTSVRPKNVVRELHRILVGNVPEGYITDHINGCALDNRRENLRIIPKAEHDTYTTRKILQERGWDVMPKTWQEFHGVEFVYPYAAPNIPIDKTEKK